MNRMRCLVAATVLALVGLSVESADAQELKLPQDSRAWLNSPPFSLEMLKGKGVVLYFFEEG